METMASVVVVGVVGVPLSYCAALWSVGSSLRASLTNKVKSTDDGWRLY
jgi:hypothetical protein